MYILLKHPDFVFRHLNLSSDKNNRSGQWIVLVVQQSASQHVRRYGGKDDRFPSWGWRREAAHAALPSSW